MAGLMRALLWKLLIAKLNISSSQVSKWLLRCTKEDVTKGG